MMTLLMALAMSAPPPLAPPDDPRHDCIMSLWRSPILPVWTAWSIDEGVDTFAYGSHDAAGTTLLSAVIEGAKGPDDDTPPPPSPPLTPIQECRREALEACGQGKICWVYVAAQGGGICAYACQDGHGNCPPPPPLPGVPSSGAPVRVPASSTGEVSRGGGAGGTP